MVFTAGGFLEVAIYVCMCVYIYIHTHTHIYIQQIIYWRQSFQGIYVQNNPHHQKEKEGISVQVTQLQRQVFLFWENSFYVRPFMSVWFHYLHRVFLSELSQELLIIAKMTISYKRAKLFRNHLQMLLSPVGRKDIDDDFTLTKTVSRESLEKPGEGTQKQYELQSFDAISQLFKKIAR